MSRCGDFGIAYKMKVQMSYLVNNKQVIIKSANNSMQRRRNFNFERLQRDTSLTEVTGVSLVCVRVCVIMLRYLCRPISLELTAVNEGIVLDNIEVFRKNGFEFAIDEDGTVLIQ